MKHFKPPFLEGAGGGKSGQSGGEAPNTLQSDTIAKYIDLLGEGPIEGLVTGDEQSIFFNKVPVKNADGTYNFDGFGYALSKGTPDQVALKGFPNIPTEFQGPGQITAEIPQTYRTNADKLDRLVVTLQFNALTSADKKTGEIKGTSVEFRISIRSNANQSGGQFVSRVLDIVSGKTTSPYQKSYDIGLQGAPGPYDVKVERITPDSDSVTTQDSFGFTSVTEIVDHKIAYSDSAVIGAIADAKVFGTNLPTRGYEIYGLHIQYPSNYDPLSRTYTGYWNGTFTTGYCTNPAWVLYALATHKRYGLGIDPSAIDKFELYSIAQYCDELVPNGYGGQEPRFVFNGIVGDRQEAYKVLQSVASMMRGIMFYASGAIIARVNREPDEIWKTFTLANVSKDGFVYSSTSRKARHNRAIVKYLDANERWQERTVAYEDRAAIIRDGLNSLDLTAIGTTSRGQGFRYGKWAIVTEQLETEAVQFQADLNAWDVLPADIIEIADPQFAVADFAGRVLAITTNTVTLDRPITITANDNPYIHLTLPAGPLEDPNGGKIVNRSVVRFYSRVNDGSGEHTVLHLETPIPQQQLPDLNIPIVWAVSTDTLAPTEWRVLTVEDKDDGTYKITATQFIREKFDIVDEDAILDIDPTKKYSNLPSTAYSPPPVNFDVRSEAYYNAGSLTVTVNCDWQPNGDPWLKTYYVGYQKDNASWIWVDTQGGTNHSFEDLAPGNYVFAVYALNRFGTQSKYVYKTVSLSGATAVGKDLVYNIHTSQGGLSFTGINASISWNASPIVFVLESLYTKYTPIYATENLPNPGAVAFDVSDQNNPKITVTGTWHAGDEFQIWVGRAAVVVTAAAGDTNATIAQKISDQFRSDVEFSNTLVNANVVSLHYTDPLTKSDLVNSGIDPYFKNFVVRIYNADNNVLRRTEYTKDPAYTYQYADNVTDGGGLPTRDIRFDIAVQDIFGGLSNFDSANVSNPPPTLSNASIVVQDAALVVDYTPPSDPDFEGIVIFGAKFSGFNPDNTTLLYQGPGHPATVLVGYNTTEYIRYGYYDQFGTAGILISGERSFSTGNPTDQLDLTPPATPTGLSVTSDTQADPVTGQPFSKLIIDYNANAEPDLAGYNISITQDGGNEVIFPTVRNHYELRAPANTGFTVKVAAYDFLQNTSAYTASTHVTTAKDTIPPGPVTSFDVSAGVQSLWLRWTNPTDADLAYVEVWQSSTSDLASAAQIATAQAAPGAAGRFSKSNLSGTPTLLYYWLRTVDTSGNKGSFVSAAGVAPLQVGSADIQAGAIGIAAISAGLTLPLIVSKANINDGTIYAALNGSLAFNIYNGKMYRNTGAAGANTAWALTVSDNLAANSVVAGTIQAGAVGVNELAANSVTAKAIAVIGEGYVRDPNFTDFSLLSAVRYDYKSATTTYPTAGDASQGWYLSNLASDPGAADQIGVPSCATLYGVSLTDADRVRYHLYQLLSDASFWIPLEGNTTYELTSIFFNASNQIAYCQIDLFDKNNTYVSGGAAISCAAGAYRQAKAAQFVTPATAVKGRIVAYNDATSVLSGYMRVTAANVRKAASATLIVDGAITAAKLTVDAVMANSIISNVTTTGVLNANVIKAGTNLDGSIYVGSTGVTIGTVQSNAADPATVINGKSTLINPGLVKISGGNTLSSWIYGGDNTSINGGAVAANTLAANKLKVGSRGISFQDLNFSINTATQVCSWSSGYIFYENDAGTRTVVAISGGNGGAFTGAYQYIYWAKDSGSLVATTSWPTATAADNVHIATYQGGGVVTQLYGGTVIDGTQINTGSITATQVAVGSLSADRMATGTLTVSWGVGSSGKIFLDGVNNRIVISD